MRTPSYNSPQLIKSDGFTPLTRTPWAGQAIVQDYKQHLFPDRKIDPVGESWEFSCDPELPSYLDGTSTLVSEWVKHSPQEVLSAKLVTSLKAQNREPSCEILVKLLNASEPLSLQVHPKDEDPNLNHILECGKPESWLVLNAEPGSGLFLGFSQAISHQELRNKLAHGIDLKPFLQFIPVKKGDFFNIPPWVPHSIGPGVVLLEPQRILPGKSGKTYRLWDWNRKYDKNGKKDLVNGAPRHLHVEESLRIIDPMDQVGLKFIQTLKVTPLTELVDGAEVLTFGQNSYYETRWIISKELPSNKNLTININDGYGILFCAQGSGKIKDLLLRKGQTALLPNKAMPCDLVFTENSSEFVLLTPVGALTSLQATLPALNK